MIVVSQKRPNMVNYPDETMECATQRYVGEIIRTPCKKCNRLTANLGRVCKYCLDPNFVVPLSHPKLKNKYKPGSGVRAGMPRKKYSDEQVKQVLAAFKSAQERRIMSPVNEAARMIDLTYNAVRYILSQNPH